MKDEEKDISTKESEQSIRRREFLLKSGKYALYASPVVVALLAPRSGVYAASAPGGFLSTATTQLP